MPNFSNKFVSNWAAFLKLTEQGVFRQWSKETRQPKSKAVTYHNVVAQICRKSKNVTNSQTIRQLWPNPKTARSLWKRLHGNIFGRMNSLNLSSIRAKHRLCILLMKGQQQQDLVIVWMIKNTGEATRKLKPLHFLVSPSIYRHLILPWFVRRTNYGNCLAQASRIFAREYANYQLISLLNNSSYLTRQKIFWWSLWFISILQ